MRYNLKTKSGITTFRSLIYNYFDAHGRQLPWRADYAPYHIYVSEVMLQQTQVDRVIDKFTSFIERFPDLPALAAAPLDAVMAQWQGLGYNRRATALRGAAKILCLSGNGTIPQTPEALQQLPGIGPATAASIAAFAYNQPTLFLETNIRTVFIHHFFADKSDVPDSELLPLANLALDTASPRRWYSALMDYGTMLKKQVGNLTRKSTTYQKQSPFIGSRRQMRGKILKLLVERKAITIAAMSRVLQREAGELGELLAQLIAEGMVEKVGRSFRIAP